MGAGLWSSGLGAACVVSSRIYWLKLGLVKPVDARELTQQGLLCVQLSNVSQGHLLPLFCYLRLAPLSMYLGDAILLRGLHSLATFSFPHGSP